MQKVLAKNLSLVEHLWRLPWFRAARESEAKHGSNVRRAQMYKKNYDTIPHSTQQKVTRQVKNDENPKATLMTLAATYKNNEKTFAWSMKHVRSVSNRSRSNVTRQGAQVTEQNKGISETFPFALFQFVVSPVRDCRMRMVSGTYHFRSHNLQLFSRKFP